MDAIDVENSKKIIEYMMKIYGSSWAVAKALWINVNTLKWFAKKPPRQSTTNKIYHGFKDMINKIKDYPNFEY